MQALHWDDYKVAYQVAQSGSLNKAAKVLQCNHATVLRHVNRLEEALNIKLFIRHQRGYKLTDAGHILVSEMPVIYEGFNRLEQLISSVEQDISGNLRITTLPEFSHLLNPALLAFRKNYPEVRLQLISTDELIPLASGAAHVSLRAGPQPQDPDLIAKKVLTVNMRYYASNDYINEFGKPTSLEEYSQHNWVMPSADKQHIPYVRKVLEHIKPERIVYQSNHFLDIRSAVESGIGIGLISEIDAQLCNNLQELVLEDVGLTEPSYLWFAYHRDLKSNAKVKKLYSYLLEHLQDIQKKQS